MEAAVQLVPLMFLSVLAFWKPHALLFQIVMGMSLLVGLDWFNAYPTDAGLSISVMLVAYSLVAGAFGLKVMLWDGDGGN